MNHTRPQSGETVASTASADHAFDTRHVVPNSRQPLRESTGNAQQPHASLPGLALCSPSPLASLSPSTIASHLPTPVIASQAGGSSFGTGLRPRRERLRSQWRTRNQNPFYDHAQFRQYRNRQDQKEEKDGQKWPPVLEDPFLDALLLIPDMGRSKYFMHHSLHGRNMIISMYVWMAYCMSLPPGMPPNEATHKRDRKAISSHIQVLKNFFKEHRFFHFFFPTKDEEQRRGGKNETRTVETMSLKNNPVLVALAEGRFPDVRPNYEYFAHLLAQNSTVTVRPKSCWVFVSSPEISIDETRTARDRTGNALDAGQYPQLAKALGDGESPQRGPDGSVLLHEYTRATSQTYSATTKEMCKMWETAFPALYDSLSLPEPQDENSLTILEMTVMLELHKSHFPSGSELNGLIEMTIALPSLQNHRWKCVTRLARPKELCSDPENDPSVMEHTDEVGVQYTHQAGCGEGAAKCDCMSRPRQDVRVPFPAAEWASMLTNCASYPESPSADRRRRALDDKEEPLRQEVTQRELISRIGMLQELWSCPPHAQHGAPGQWSRQAVILWRFRDVYQFSPKKKKKWVAEPAGTSWRFLTVNDPGSEYHMKNAYLPATPSQSHGSNGVLSPGGFGSGLNVSVNDYPPWADVGIPGQLRALSAATNGLDFGHFQHGLTTPPPTATLPSSYPSSFETSHEMGGHQLSFLGASCSTPVDSQASSLLGDVPGSADPFLSATGGVNVPGVVDVGYENECDSSLQHWDAPVLDAWSPVQYAPVDHPLPSGEKTEWSDRDWDKGWSPGQVGLRGWDDRGPSVTTAPNGSLGCAAGECLAPTPDMGLGSSPLKGLKRSRPDGLDLDEMGRGKMRRVDGGVEVLAEHGHSQTW